MASNARIFFAGVGTTFLILGVGFGGGLILASSTLKQPAAYQARATAEPPSPIRVILPASADAAQPPQLPQQSAAESAPEPAKEVQPTMRIEGTDTKKWRTCVSAANGTRIARPNERLPSVSRNV